MPSLPLPRRALVAAVTATLAASALATAASADAPEGRIAFASLATGAGDLYTISPDGSRPDRVTDDPARDAQPDWSPDGRRIAFRGRATGQYEVYTVAQNGNDRRQLTSAGPDFYSTQPAWTPDGGEIVFRSNRPPSDASDIWRMGADGSAPRLVATLPGDQLYPTLSPDASTYLFVTRGPAAPDDAAIFTLTADGTDLLKAIDHPGASDSAPAWSPDGSKIAFESNVDGDMEIYVARADGTAIQQLTRNDVHDEGPAWSPDGRRIAFTSARDEPNGEIYVMDAASGMDVHRLTFSSAVEESPDWQPRPKG